VVALTASTSPSTRARILHPAPRQRDTSLDHDDEILQGVETSELREDDPDAAPAATRKRIQIQRSGTDFTSGRSPLLSSPSPVGVRQRWDRCRRLIRRAPSAAGGGVRQPQRSGVEPAAQVRGIDHVHRLATGGHDRPLRRWWRGCAPCCAAPAVPWASRGRPGAPRGAGGRRPHRPRLAHLVGPPASASSRTVGERTRSLHRVVGSAPADSR
jgi:hypothetical protein